MEQIKQNINGYVFDVYITVFKNWVIQCWYYQNSKHLCDQFICNGKTVTVWNDCMNCIDENGIILYSLTFSD